jgi:MFS family permease
VYPTFVRTLRELVLAASGRTLAGGRVGRNVVLLGITSCLTDISSEMVTSILPIYVVLQLQLSPAAFGAVDGLHQGGASLARLLGGFLADRLRRYKAIAATGYLLSAACRIGFLAAQGTASFALWIGVDRVGKGIRTSPRDALISLAASKESLGRAFGLHRALDTAGAMLGPVVAFGILYALPAAYDVLFVVSLTLALIGVGVLVSFVRDPDPSTGTEHAAVGWAEVRGLFSDPKFLRLVPCAGALGLMTISDGFLYLLLQHRLQFDASYVPLLYVATPAVFMVFAVPLGQIADRLGRGRLVLCGYGMLLLAYGAALCPLPAVPSVLLTVTLLGLFYAATDGVLMALASALLPEGLRASGLAFIGALNGVGRLLASLSFGLLWAEFDEAAAVAVFGAGTVVVLFSVTLALGPVLRAEALARRQA